jgi:hypothetical protein
VLGYVAVASQRADAHAAGMLLDGRQRDLSRVLVESNPIVVVPGG